MGFGVGFGEGAKVGVNVGETVSVFIIGGGFCGETGAGLGSAVVPLLGLVGGGGACSCVCVGSRRKREKWG